MPVGLAGRALQEVVDQGASGTVASDIVWVREGLNIITLLDIRDEAELLDNFLGASSIDATPAVAAVPPVQGKRE